MFTKIHHTDYKQLLHQSSAYPVLSGRIGPRAYWLYAGKWFWDNDDLTVAEIHALLVAREQRRQATVNRAQSIVAMRQAPTPTPRGAIPDDVKQFVWARDGGCCRQCGSTVELQFDHIIPVSMGGASTPANLQILCGPCNRRKGASVV